MHIHNSRLIVAAVLVLLGMSPLVLADEARDRAVIEAAAQAWIKAFNARDVDALAALMTNDVVLLDPNFPPVSGREAAREALARAVSTAKGKVASATKEISVADDLAWRIGAFAHKMPNDIVSRGQALEIWKRTNGGWKIHRQMSSSILARPRLLPQPLPPEPILDTPVD